MGTDTGGNEMNIKKQGDTDWIPVTNTALKKRIGRYVIYDYHWLLDHIDMETKVLKDSKEKIQKNTDYCEMRCIEEMRKAMFPDEPIAEKRFCESCKNFKRVKDGIRGGVKGKCMQRSYFDIRSGRAPACKRYEPKEASTNE